MFITNAIWLCVWWLDDFHKYWDLNLTMFTFATWKRIHLCLWQNSKCCGVVEVVTLSFVSMQGFTIKMWEPRSKISPNQSTSCQTLVMAAYAESLGDQLACPLCQNKFEDPRILPCLHSFCKRCLEQIHQRQSPGPSGQEPVLHCPTCHQNVPLNSGGIENLPSNLFLSSIFDTFVGQHELEPLDLDRRAITGTKWCNSCNEGSKASCLCKNCSEFLCDNCVRAHQRVTLTRDHFIERFASMSLAPGISIPSPQLVPPLSSPSLPQGSPSSIQQNLPIQHSDQDNYCTRHENGVLRLYCDSCDKAICRECTINDHVGHNIIYLQDAIENSKTVTLKLLADAKAGIKALEESIVLTQVIVISPLQTSLVWSKTVIGRVNCTYSGNSHFTPTDQFRLIQNNDWKS